MDHPIPDVPVTRDGVFAGVNTLVEVIGGAKPITVEDYVAATRSRFDTSGRPRR